MVRWYLWPYYKFVIYRFVYRYHKKKKDLLICFIEIRHRIIYNAWCIALMRRMIVKKLVQYESLVFDKLFVLFEIYFIVDWCSSTDNTFSWVDFQKYNLIKYISSISF